MKKKQISHIAGLLLCTVVQHLRAQTAATLVNEFVGDDDNYNLISLGNVSLNGVSDTGGGLSIDGSLAVENQATTFVAMNNAPGNPEPALYVTGSLTIGSSGNNTEDLMVNNGYGSLMGAAAQGWTWSGSPNWNLTMAGQPDLLHFNSHPTGSPADPANNPLTGNPAFWSNLQSSFSTISQTFNTYAQTQSSAPAGTQFGSTSVSGQNLVFDTNGATSGVVLFNINMASTQLSGVSNISVGTANSSLTYVINVTNLTSAAQFLSGINVNSGSNSANVLWNLSSATDHNFTFSNNGGTFYGSVLAPGLTLATSTGENVNLEGNLVVGGLTANNDQLEMNSLPLVAIPETANYALWAGAAATGAYAWRLLARRSSPASPVREG